jgi:hypothetical protein
VGAPDHTSPADRILDLFVFAPAGLALTLVEELPNLVEKGRNRIEGRTATARVVGQFAVQMGFREVSRRARQLVDPEPPKRREAPAVDHTAHQAPGSSPSVGRTLAETEEQPGEIRVPYNSASEGPDHGSADTNGSAALGDLAIPAYDTLSASQVVKRLDGLSREELREVGEHERQNRHRATILTKVEQLLSGEPSPEA